MYRDAVRPTATEYMIGTPRMVFVSETDFPSQIPFFSHNKGDGHTGGKPHRFCALQSAASGKVSLTAGEQNGCPKRSIKI